jgi:hypothetical protein
MPKLTLNIEFSKNDGLVMSPSNLQNLYLAGIPLCYPNGGRVSQELIKQKLLSAQKFLENYLSIKFQKQIITEEQDFNKQEFTSWGYIRTVFPINVAKKLEGRINNITQITYPESWLSVKDSNDSTRFRNLHIIPNTQGSTEQNQYSVVYSGIAPTIGYFGSNNIPNYWRVTYCTGWDADDLPYDLLDAVGKIAAIQVLAITGDLIFGAGVGNQSISIDGISQTYSTTKGGGKGAFAGRIDQYKNELEQSLKDLKSEYLGIMFRAF